MRHHIIFYIILVATFIVMFYLFRGIPAKVTFSYSGVITDKWTKQRSSFGSYTVYVFEINDNSTVDVDDLVYHNYDVGDLYSWNETIIRFNKPFT